MRRRSLAFLVGWIALTLAIEPIALASDGKLEINQDCAAVGCFPGDNGGLPLEITVAGSYILTSDLVFSGGGSAVNISASGVFLDLGGFTLRGDSLMMNVAMQISGVNVEVSHGLITSFDVGIIGNNAHRLRLRDLTINGIDGAAISLGMTSEAQIRDSFISGNGAGVDAPGDRMMVVGCTVSSNTAGDGIRVGFRSLVADNVVTSNSGDGIDVADASTVRGNVVHGNLQHGIRLFGNDLVIGNTVLMSGMMFPNIQPCATCLLVDNLAP